MQFQISYLLLMDESKYEGGCTHSVMVDFIYVTVDSFLGLAITSK